MISSFKNCKLYVYFMQPICYVKYKGLYICVDPLKWLRDNKILNMFKFHKQSVSSDFFILLVTNLSQESCFFIVIDQDRRTNLFVIFSD